MVSGWISVVATVALGGFSLYQNKRYKEMADKYNEEIESLTIMPEIILLQSDFFDNEAPPIVEPSHYYYPDVHDGYFFYLSFIFTVANEPVLDITIQNVSFQYYSSDVIFKDESRKCDELRPFKILYKKDHFQFITSLPKRCSADKMYSFDEATVNIEFIYKNIYEIEYIKAIKLLIKNGGCKIIKIEKAQMLKSSGRRP